MKFFRILGICLCIFTLCFSFCFADDTSSQNTESRTDVEIQSDIQTEVLRVSADDTSGFHSVILGLIGDYNPIAVTTAYQYPYGNGYQTRYQVDVEPDWSWILSTGIFIVVIYCVFRIIGIALGGIK